MRFFSPFTLAPFRTFLLRSLDLDSCSRCILKFELHSVHFSRSLSLISIPVPVEAASPSLSISISALCSRALSILCALDLDSLRCFARSRRSARASCQFSALSISISALCSARRLPLARSRSVCVFLFLFEFSAFFLRVFRFVSSIMDAGLEISEARATGQIRSIRRGNPDNLDRFIPNRSAMDFDYAHYMVTEGREKEPPPKNHVYRKRLAELFGMNRRILAFKNKPPAPIKALPAFQLFPPGFSFAPIKRRRYIPQTPERTLEAPELVDDYNLNLMDWGSSNVLSIALGNAVYLWDASKRSTSEFLTVDDDGGPITSVSWAPDGRRIAIGFNNSDVQLWDYTTNKLLRTLKDGHISRVGSLAWNNHILTAGGMDGLIRNYDLRVRSQIAGTFRSHTGEVCGLKWSACGRKLASGGSDKILHIWDRAMVSSNSPRQWLHKVEEHTSAVKALAWCPFQDNLLASGGGISDQSIKFWNTHTGTCSKSVDTGSEVSALLWSKDEKELLSSHGFARNQLTLWEYPSMLRITELTGHTSRVLFMAQSPNGCTVASAAADETLKFWDVFGDPKVPKPVPKANVEPFHEFNRIRLQGIWECCRCGCSIMVSATMIKLIHQLCNLL